MNPKQATPPTNKVPLDFYLWVRDIGTVAFAEATGISKAQISRYRNGLRPGPEDRRTIARKLKLSQADLGWAESNG